jgi:pimeloyl-ACP methyl ester carboxylesterase
MSEEKVFYIHGRGGRPEDAGRFASAFPGMSVTGIRYRENGPREAAEDIAAALQDVPEGSAVLVAESIGAYFAMLSGAGKKLCSAFFVSPLVDMEAVILAMLRRAGVSEKELMEKGELFPEEGETLSWGYLSYVREHPISWGVPTEIICGSEDDLVPLETLLAFAENHNACLTVLEGAGHWFHTKDELEFISGRIKAARQNNGYAPAGDRE